MVRADWTFYSSHPALFLSTYLAHGLLVDYFEKKRRCGIRNQEDSSTNLEWLASLWDWYTSYLLHPIASLQQVPSDQSDWEDDPSFFFERLAFPDLWLHPLVNVDYIKSLPTWRFKASGQPRGDNKTGSSQSESTDSPVSSQQGSMCPTKDAFLTSIDWSAWPCNVLHCSECVVCLENFVSEELLMALPCCHAFHQQCIVVWLAAGRHCCPVCRWPSYKKKHGSD